MAASFHSLPYQAAFERFCPLNIEPRYALICDGDVPLATLCMQVVCVDLQQVGKGLGNKDVEKAASVGPSIIRWLGAWFCGVCVGEYLVCSAGPSCYLLPRLSARFYSVIDCFDRSCCIGQWLTLQHTSEVIPCV